MYKTNKIRRKQLYLAHQETRKLYHLMKMLMIFFLLSISIIFLIGKVINIKQLEIKNKLFGTWDTIFLDVNETELMYFKKHAFIDRYSIQKIYQDYSLKDSNQLVIGYADDSFFQIGKINLLSGRMPINNKEVAIEKEYLSYLGVSKIGDIIAQDCDIDSLQGYRVCGIINNYSSRWKLVNWDLKYINCFISNIHTDIHTEKIQVYTVLNEKLKKDLKTNLINYRDNIVLNDINIFDKILKIGIVILFLESCIYLSLRLKLNKTLTYCRITREKGLIKKWILKIIFLMFLIISVFCVNLLLRQILNESNYINDMRIMSVSTNIHDSDFFKMNEKGNIKVISDKKHKGDLVELQYIPNKYLSSVLENTFYFSWLLLINYVISFIHANYIILYSVEINVFRLHHYYFGNKKNIYLFIKSLLKQTIFQMLLFIIIFQCNYYEINQLNDKLVCITIGLIIIFLVNLIRFISIEKQIKKEYSGCIDKKNLFL